MQSIGPVGILLIVIVALILFGPKRLPELGRAFGRTLRAFREGTRETIDEVDVQRDDSSRRDASQHTRLPD